MSRDRGAKGLGEHRLGAAAGLPDAYFDLAPELRDVDMPDERRADCSACVMTPEVSGDLPESPWVFRADARCCTFHPVLENFAVGYAMGLHPSSARVVRERVRMGEGVSAWGIRAPAGWRARYQRVALREFGRDLGLRCPYWVGGQDACGIWAMRPPTCRTWFCKHERGLQGAVLWSQLGAVLGRVGAVLARYCVDELSGSAPPLAESGDNAHVDAWLAWYGRCADLVAGTGADTLARLAEDASLVEARADFRAVALRPARVMPDVLVPAVREIAGDPRGIRVSGYSIYDTVIAPSALLRFLSRLDGNRTWQEALEPDESGGESISSEMVSELYRIGALEAPGEPDPTVIRRIPWPSG